jgi:hypothetical protein
LRRFVCAWRSVESVHNSLFDSVDEMHKGGEAFAAMDPADTLGTCASVDVCEIKVDRHV